MAVNNNRECQQALREVRETVRRESIAQQLREVNTFLDPNGAATKKLYEHMPEALKKYTAWKREASTLIADATDMALFLIQIFVIDNNSEDDLYDEFSSMEEIEKLNNAIAHSRVIDGMTLAQDAARDFAQWDRWHTSFLKAGAATEAVCGAAAVLLGMATAPLAGTITAGAILCQFLYGWDRISMNKKGKKQLTEKALDLSDITDSIERDVQMLDEIAVYVRNIERCQRAARERLRISKIQKDKITSSAKKVVNACQRYTNSSE